jgi:predicted nucleic acid-binding protein
LIVVDTNVMVYFWVPGDLTDQAVRVYRKDPEWVAPTLWRSEFLNALALSMRRGLLALEDALEVIERAEGRMQGQELKVASAGVLRLAQKSGCSAYDCEFVWLAQDLGVSLVTADQEILAKFGPPARSMQEFCA